MYLHWAIKNESTTAVDEVVKVAIRLDGFEVQSFLLLSGIGAEQIERRLSIPIKLGSFGTNATYELSMEVDANRLIAESDELDNTYSATFSTEGPIVGEFTDWPSYEGDCSARPTGSTCLGVSDGYVWLICDSVDRSDVGVFDGIETVSAVTTGFDYHHVLGTTLVRLVGERESRPC